MIIDLPRFVAGEKQYWEELESVLRQLEANPERRLPVPEIQRLHYLYERCSADLARLDTFSTDPRLREFLGSLVSRAYSEIHETRAPLRIEWRKLILAFPRAFRRHLRAFQLAAGITMLGCAFGAFAVHQDPRSKALLLPFPGLMQSPAERVAREEHAKQDRLQGVKATFSAQLMSNNIRVTHSCDGVRDDVGRGHRDPALLQRRDPGGGGGRLHRRGSRAFSQRMASTARLD